MTIQLTMTCSCVPKLPSANTPTSVDLLHAYSNQSLSSPSAELVVAAARKSARRAKEAPVVRRARQLREDEVAALIAYYREYGSVAATAKAFGITRQTAGQHLARAGVVTTSRMSPEQVALAVRRYAEGGSATAIGRELGFSTHLVLNALRSCDVVIRH